MAVVLSSKAPGPSNNRTPSSQSSADPASPPPQHKSFKQMVRASLGETIRTATRSKGKNKVTDAAMVANEAGFAASLGLASSTSRLSKEQDRSKIKERAREKESAPRPSTDTTESQMTVERGGGAIRRLSSRTVLGFKKHLDTSQEASMATSSRTRGGGWPSFMTPSQSTGSISSPALHLSSDPSSQNDPDSHIPSSSTSIRALISPPRARRPTVSSRDSAGSGSTPTAKKPSSSNGTSRPAPSPPTLLLASSSKNSNTRNKRIPPSPSTPTLPTYPTEQATSPTRGIIRRSNDRQDPSPLARSPTLVEHSTRRGERSVSRSESGSGSGSGSISRSPSPPGTNTGLGRAGGRRPSISLAPSPSPPPRRSSTDRRGSFDQRTQRFGSISASHLPLGAAPSAIPSQHSPMRNQSRDRPTPPPIITGQSPSTSTGLYQRRNSSSTSFSNNRPTSPPSTTDTRTQSPVYRAHGRNASTSSLAGAIISPQREALRLAASFIVKEMSKPPPAVLKSTSTISPHGGLAGAPAGVKTDAWDEVERRLLPLARLERIWGRSGVSGTSSSFGTLGNHSNAAVNVSSTAATVSGGGEERERRIFCEGLRDGYVLAQLMNKLIATSPLPIPRVDPREDGLSRTSNMLKFRESAKDYIIMSGPNGKDLAKEMFGKDDLADGRPEAVARVARVISIISALKGDPSSGQRRVSMSRERPMETSVASVGSESSTATITPLTRRQTSPTKKRLSPPSPGVDRMTPELSSDSQGSSGMLERRTSTDRIRRLGPAPTSLPPTPPRTSLASERRTSASGQFAAGLGLTPPSPPMAPPRSLLRPAPSFTSNRASVASSAQTQTTDQTNLFDNRYSNVSNRFGTMRTMNTMATDATSVLPDGSNSGSWGRSNEDAVLALGLSESLEAAAAASSPPPNLRRKSHDFKNQQSSGLGLALQQSHPPVSSADYLQDNGSRPQRRDRRSSEVAADLAKVLEETPTDIEGSIKPLHRKPSESRPRAAMGLNLGKAKFPEDFVARFERTPLPAGRPVTPPLDEDDDDPFLSPRPMISEVFSSSPIGGKALRDQDVTPKAKQSYSGMAPITIVTTASRQPTPREEKEDPNSLSPSASNVAFRRPTHRAGSQSVDVLLPRATERRVSGERRISMDRRASAERAQQLLLRHDRGSSSGSQDSPSTGDAPVLRPLRRASTRRESAARQAVYIPKRLASNEDLGSSSSLIPAVASVPAVSHIRVPFPRTSSGENPPLGPPKDPDHSTPTRPSLNRPRYQSELETPRMTRRGSSGLAVQMQRRGSAGAENHVVPRSRFDSTHDMNGSAIASSSKLTRASSTASAIGGGTRRTIIVAEPGKAPMHYQLGNCIGKGQFGAVYRALNLNTGQMVAVKRISLEGLPESEVTQLMKEVDLLKKLKHPSIVSYEGMSRDDDALDIVLEYVENGSLGQTLKAFGKFNEKLVATYVTKIIEGLHYLHEQKVVHCDLKAANILSTKNGNVKLSDFGVSLSLNAMETAMETHKENVAGTPNWMAPEVIELKGASPASDIWSLGCTIVELLTGKPPYSEIGNTLAVMFRIVEDPNPPIPEGCSEPLRDFLSLCFKKDPADRPTPEELFEHPWLKRTWGLNKELRPEDSVPFLRRVSTDLQARQMSIQNLAEMSQAQERATPVVRTPSDEPEFVVKPHSFVKTTFSKAVTCKVCHQSVKKSAVLCEECSLICHSSCAKDASSHCDVRAQLLLYKQYSYGGTANGSPHVSTPATLPSPSLPSPGLLDHPPLSSSPSFHNKIFAWKRNSKNSTTDQIPSSPLTTGEERNGSQRRNGGGLFFGRRSEDRSRSRRDSVHGGSQNSASTRSANTGQSHGSTFRGRSEFGGNTTRMSAVSANSELQQTPMSSQQLHRPTATPTSSTVLESSTRPSEATVHRRRQRKDSLAGSRSDCIIQ